MSNVSGFWWDRWELNPQMTQGLSLPHMPILLLSHVARRNDGRSGGRTMKNTVDFRRSEQLLRHTQVAERNYYEKGNLWLWHSDLNRGMMESKSNALPLGDATSLTFIFIWVYLREGGLFPSLYY